MEFSFDRSNDSHYRNTSNTKSAAPQAAPQVPQQKAEPVMDASAQPDTSTIANERLRKAIEKNRARQAERSRQYTAQSSAASQPAPVQEQVQAQAHEQASFFEKQQTAAQQERVEPTPEVKASAAVVTRRSVARPNEADFTPVKRTPRKVSSQISYTTNRKKTKPLDPKLITYLVKGSWILCGVMVLRLIFANGGVMDFYSQKSLHNDRLSELSRIKKENMAFVLEIEKMQTDIAFQKKLVRDNLGFIAKDEFLVLFPKENVVH